VEDIGSMNLGSRGCRAYSELPLLAVEVCKVKLDVISVAQNTGMVVRVHRANGDQARGV
jgi:hypothetical protein